MIAIRRWAGGVLGAVQGTERYRRLARVFAWKVRTAEASEKDLKAIGGWREFRAHGCFPYNPHVTNFVVRVGCATVGFAQLVFQLKGSLFHKWWIYRVYVRPAFRRMGAGEALMRAAIERARSLGSKNLALLVYEENIGALKLYSKLGFKINPVLGSEKDLDREAQVNGWRRVAMSLDLS
ncbi:MAG: GNAT family N-acetyltransferase [Candidatus Omnitrophica bacterium]|nr:GNAT family N-acetyltransferase [Candidatus Omnitrophota bacterium]